MGPKKKNKKCVSLCLSITINSTEKKSWMEWNTSVFTSKYLLQQDASKYFEQHRLMCDYHLNL